MVHVAERLLLKIELPGLPGTQRAEALPALTAAQLIANILQEFQGELEWLGQDERAYELLTADGDRLSAEETLQEQGLPSGSSLALVEREPSIPERARRAPQPLYLREQRQGYVVRLHWLPALIGRHSEHLPNDDLIAFDLQGWPTGQRVSRRHVALGREGGTFSLRLLSNNSVTILRDEEEVTTLVDEGDSHPIEVGDVIRLDRADILLKFIARE